MNPASSTLCDDVIASREDPVTNPSPPTPEQIAALRGLTLFQNTTDADVASFLGLSCWEEYPAWTTLIEEGSTTGSLWLVVKGRVVGTMSGTPQPLFVLDAREGDVVGAVALYRKNVVQPVRVCTVEPVALVRFDTETVMKLGARGSPIVSLIEDLAIRTLAQRVRDCNVAIGEALRPTGGFTRVLRSLRGLLGG